MNAVELADEARQLGVPEIGFGEPIAQAILMNEGKWAPSRPINMSRIEDNDGVPQVTSVTYSPEQAWASSRCPNPGPYDMAELRNYLASTPRERRERIWKNHILGLDPNPSFRTWRVYLVREE